MVTKREIMAMEITENEIKALHLLRQVLANTHGFCSAWERDRMWDGPDLDTAHKELCRLLDVKR